ncbi:hypothetical protein ACJIZ3_011020 [Penstemon smallii]|uniref:Uncharacterized protein n=1 Tax=Penstemon smallii TaxID=265156 RepID=A0ABD3UM66_9LAMI
MNLFIMHFRTLGSHLVFFLCEDVRIVGNLYVYLDKVKSCCITGFLFYHHIRYLFWLLFRDYSHI